MSGDAPELRDATPRPSDAGDRAAPNGQRAEIVHDFNNILMTIMATVAEALARPGLDGVSRAEFSEIGDAARRGAALARPLLDGGRLAAPVLVGIDSALRAMAPLLRRALGDATLSLTLEQPEAAVRIDPAHLDRVLMNLALNARNAMPGGGVLDVRSGVRDVTEAVSQFGDAVSPGRYVTIAVRDTGTGIPAALMPRLFEPYFTTRAGAGGTGLGLASVRGLVRQAGGFLGVDSEPGRGTTMWVHLPRHEAPSRGGTQPARIDDAASAPPVRQGTVLLVDDETVLLRLAERALSRAGWGVLAAASASAALDAARDADRAPCVVVSDMALPDRDGLALVAEMRALFPGMPAILTSGYAGEALRARAAAAGVALLVKPFGMAELLDAVAGTLQPGC